MSRAIQDPIDSIIAGLGRSRDDVSGGPKAKRAVLDLKKLWVAERMSPTLLAYAEDTLEQVMKQIRELIIFIEEKSLLLHEGDVASTGHDGENIKLQLLVVETDLERAKFVARGYLRARLAKIDKYAIYWSTLPPQDTPLSVREQEYLQRRLMVREKLYDSSFLLSMDSNLHSLADRDAPCSMIDEPDLEKPVAIKVSTAGLDPVEVGNESIILENGGIYMMRYSAIAGLPVELV